MVRKIKNKKLIIAGPCAIESEKQFDFIAQEIHQHVDIIRAGVWKGRTSPQDYSGIGKKALQWIKRVQKKYHTPVAIEVGTPQHLALAIKNDISIVWLGARTTSNPFAVEEIANIAKGLNLEVWIKNPIIPDLKLWCGAIERFKQKGILKLKSIHRGFHSDTNMDYRNHPKWDLVMKFKKTHPDIPIICDPSHIAGSRKYIYEITEQAYGVFDGIMLEVHNQPAKALSDSKQQINPEDFKKLLKKLTVQFG